MDPSVGAQRSYVLQNRDLRPQSGRHHQGMIMYNLHQCPPSLSADTEENAKHRIEFLKVFGLVLSVGHCNVLSSLYNGDDAPSTSDCESSSRQRTDTKAASEVGETRRVFKQRSQMVTDWGQNKIA